MKAAVHTRYGPPDVVQIAQVATPSPGDGELLVKVHATTVNRTDCHYRSGRPLFMRPLASGLTRPKATVLGNEFAGQVVEAGERRHLVPGRRSGIWVHRGPSGAHPNTW